MNRCPNCDRLIEACRCHSIFPPEVPTCFCGKPLEISPPIPDGREADTARTYCYLCPEHKDLTTIEAMWAALLKAEEERDVLRSRSTLEKEAAKALLIERDGLRDVVMLLLEMAERAVYPSEKPGSDWQTVKWARQALEPTA